MLRLSPEYMAIAEKNAKTILAGYKTIDAINECISSTERTVERLSLNLASLKNRRKILKEAVAYIGANLRRSSLAILDEDFIALARLKKDIAFVREQHDQRLIYLTALEIARDKLINGAKPVKPINAPKSTYNYGTKTLKMNRSDAYKMLKKLVDFMKDKEAQEITFDIE